MEFQEDPGEQRRQRNVTPLGRWRKRKSEGNLRVEKVRHEQGEHSVMGVKGGMLRSG